MSGHLAKSVAMVIFGLACFSASWAYPRYKTYRARLAWKEQAIPIIADMAYHPGRIGEEIAFLRNGTSGQDGRLLAEPWLSDRMILMDSGEWLVYKSHCKKEAPRDVSDICIARGSDGQWYYTTVHFCVGMIALMMMQDEQPADLSSFIHRYHFRRFDGVSNECLKETKTFPDDL